MEKKRRKRGENSYLNDFHPNLAGEYIYSGTLYACALDETAQRGMRRALAALAAVQLAAVIASGSIPAPGMQNSFYVILPFLGEVVAAASVVWALAKLGTDWREVREYNYEKSVAVLPVRTVVAAGFAALGIVCEGIFFFTNKPADKAFFALLYVLLKLIVLLCALGVRAKIMRAEWDKIPKKDKS